MPALAQQKLSAFIDTIWRDEITPTLIDYIRIPNKSPMFEPDWAELGHMDKAVDLFAGWARGKLAALPGATLEVVRLPERTPVILIDVPGQGDVKADEVEVTAVEDVEARARGFPCLRATDFTAAAALTMAMPASPP